MQRTSPSFSHVPSSFAAAAEGIAATAEGNAAPAAVSLQWLHHLLQQMGLSVFANDPSSPLCRDNTKCRSCRRTPSERRGRASNRARACSPLHVERAVAVACPAKLLPKPRADMRQCPPDPSAVGATVGGEGRPSLWDNASFATLPPYPSPRSAGIAADTTSGAAETHPEHCLLRRQGRITLEMRHSFTVGGRGSVVVSGPCSS